MAIYYVDSYTFEKGFCNVMFNPVALNKMYPPFFISIKKEEFYEILNKVDILQSFFAINLYMHSTEDLETPLKMFIYHPDITNTTFYKTNNPAKQARVNVEGVKKFTIYEYRHYIQYVRNYKKAYHRPKLKEKPVNTEIEKARQRLERLIKNTKDLDK